MRTFKGVKNVVILSLACPEFSKGRRGRYPGPIEGRDERFYGFKL